MDDNIKKEVLKRIQEMENKWKEDEKRLLNDKRKLQRQIRELKKDLEIQKRKYELQLETKSQELDMIKEALGGKARQWGSEYSYMEKEKEKFESRVKELEGNLYLMRRDTSERLRQLQGDKENIIKDWY